MANPAAAPPGRVAVLGAAAGDAVIQPPFEVDLTTCQEFANMAGDAEIRVWPEQPKT